MPASNRRNTFDGLLAFDKKIKIIIIIKKHLGFWSTGLSSLGTSEPDTTFYSDITKCCLLSLSYATGVLESTIKGRGCS